MTITIFIIIILSFIIFYLGYKLDKKLILDNQEIEQYKSKKFKEQLAVERLQYEKLDLQNNINKINTKYNMYFIRCCEV